MTPTPFTVTFAGMAFDPEADHMSLDEWSRFTAAVHDAEVACADNNRLLALVSEIAAICHNGIRPRRSGPADAHRGSNRQQWGRWGRVVRDLVSTKRRSLSGKVHEMADFGVGTRCGLELPAPWRWTDDPMTCTRCKRLVKMDEEAQAVYEARPDDL